LVWQFEWLDWERAEGVVNLPPEAVPIVSLLMQMWAGTPEEVLEMIISYDGSNLDIEIIEAPHGTLQMLVIPSL